MRIRRNLFFNWQGSTGSYFVLLGEDGTANYESFDCLVENNLMLGNSPNSMRAAFGVRGSRDSTFRANTVVGNLPSLAFAFRFNREGSNPVVSGITLRNNLWSDPTTTMEDFSDTPVDESTNITLTGNGYYNGGSALASDNGESVRIADDPLPVFGDPRLPAQDGLQTPHWIAAQQQFNGGYSTIRAVFEAFAQAYGMPDSDGVGIDQADPAHMPPDDLLGRQREALPDLGAMERLPDPGTIFGDGFESD